MERQTYVPSENFVALKAAVLSLSDYSRARLREWMIAQMSAKTGRVLFPHARKAGYVGMLPAAILEMRPDDARAFYRWFMRWIEPSGRVRSKDFPFPLSIAKPSQPPSMWM